MLVTPSADCITGFDAVSFLPHFDGKAVHFAKELKSSNCSGLQLLRAESGPLFVPSSTWLVPERVFVHFSRLNDPEAKHPRKCATANLQSADSTLQVRIRISHWLIVFGKYTSTDKTIRTQCTRKAAVPV
jgi:hypothetical protein